MAKWCAAFVAAAVGLFALAGCQPAQPAALVKNLPPPNFDGPADLTPPPPAPIVRPPAPVVTVPPIPSPKGTAGVPAGWVPSVRANNWRWIVIHHSATPVGSAQMFDRMHKQKGWDELGYHFVVGNGSQTKDGEVEIGPRWRKQKWGAHAKTPDNKYNDFGIGICIVGNFDLTRPSPKQLESVSKLVAYLQKTYNIPASRVIGHGTVHTLDKGGTTTDCPGKNMNLAQIRQLSGKILADAGETVPVQPTATANGGDLLLDIKTTATH
jgi:hypothetical protein